MSKKAVVLLWGLSLLPLNGFSAGDSTKGKAYYTTCAACHGAKGEGNKALNSPSLAGQEDWYIVRQLKNFKEGIRGSNPKDIYGMQMRPMAMTLINDQAMKDVAAYIMTFSEKKPAKK